MSKRRGRGKVIEVGKIRELLRLLNLGYGVAEISLSVQVHRSTVHDYMARYQAALLTMEELKALSDKDLLDCLKKSTTSRQKKSRGFDFSKLRPELGRKGVTLLLLHKEYLARCPDVPLSYSTFCRGYKDWCSKERLSLRQDYSGGEKLFVDYAGVTVPIYDQESRELSFAASVFVAVLGASNYTYVEASRGEDIFSWLGAHTRCFEFLGGVPRVVVPDNLKSGVTKACRYEPAIQREYLALAEHYQTAVIPARIKKPRDKAKVEKAVQDIERWVLAPLRNKHFYSLHDLNAALQELLSPFLQRPMKSYGGQSRAELFTQLDKPHLEPLPLHRFELHACKTARVHPDYHVEADKHYYSVPYRYRGQQVEIKLLDRTIEIFFARERIALHIRSFVPYKHTTLAEHMPESHRAVRSYTPDDLRAWANRLGPEIVKQTELIFSSRRHQEQGIRSVQGVLRLTQKHPTEIVETACALLNARGVGSYQRLKNIIAQGDPLKASQPPQSISTHANLRGKNYFH